MEELKPCPFCGFGHPKLNRIGKIRKIDGVFQDASLWEVCCGNCACRSGPVENGRADVVKAWNRRATHD